MLRFLVRTTALFVSFLIMSTNTFSQNYDVKKVSWGMSPLEVQLSEAGPPDYDATCGGYFCRVYIIKSRRGNRTYRIAEWRYVFDGNKLVRVVFESYFQENPLVKYEAERAHFSKICGKLTRTVDNQDKVVHEWPYGDRTVIKTYLNKSPTSYGAYVYQTIYTEVVHKKMLDSKKK